MTITKTTFLDLNNQLKTTASNLQEFTLNNVKTGLTFVANSLDRGDLEVAQQMYTLTKKHFEETKNSYDASKKELLEITEKSYATYGRKPDVEIKDKTLVFAKGEKAILLAEKVIERFKLEKAQKQR